MSIQTKKTGDEGEEIAAKLLAEKGFEILERNYRYKKGEIDIVARDPATNCIVFVEVKSRKNLEYGEPEYGITKNKMSQIRRMASAYQFDKDLSELECRFDVVTVLFRGKEKPLVNHYINAFM